MSDAQAGFPRTALVSPRVGVAETSASTNADLIAAASAEPDSYPHLSLLMTMDQRAGRGRLDRAWETPTGAALALSVVLRVPTLPMAARGWIPLAAGVAMCRAVAAQLLDEEVRLKWPNDVLVNGRKICGILTEATLEREIVVVGTGVNTAMTPEQLPVPTATSFAALGAQCDIDELVATYLTELDGLLDRLTDAGGDAVASGLHAAVTAVCATIGLAVTVSLPHGPALVGRATGIEHDGRLLVLPGDGGDVVPVSAGDVVHVRPV